MTELEFLKDKSQEEKDEYFMALAIELAKEAAGRDEVPVGAVIVRGDEIVATASNDREESKCATHHAELVCIERACKAMGGWRLPQTTLYVTMEPCVMCAGAIVNARIPRVVFGTPDLRFGAFGSLIDVSSVPFNHSPEVKGGVLASESLALLREYFSQKRKEEKLRKGRSAE